MNRTFLLYKPYRMVSQFITHDHKQRKKRFLGELYDFPVGSMAVGRLDEKSEGLLLITTDGSFSDQVNRTAKWEKEYYAQVDGVITIQAIEQLRAGVDIGNNGQKYRTKPCKVKPIPEPDLPKTTQKIRDDRHGPTSWISITLTEGKFRQVRKMCSAVGFPVLRLARVRIGSLNLSTLQELQVRELDQHAEKF